MAVTAQQIVDRAETTLLDETNERWGVAELLDYLNAGIKAIVGYDPDSYVRVVNFQANANSSKQTAPDDSIVITNIFGVANGASIRKIEKRHLDNFIPNWRTTSGTPKHYVYDGRKNPSNFWLYPVPTSTTVLEMEYCAIPEDIAIGDDIPIPDTYENHLHLWVVAYALMKNTKRGDVAKGNAYMNLFLSALGAQEQAQTANSPTTDDAQART